MEWCWGSWRGRKLLPDVAADAGGRIFGFEHSVVNPDAPADKEDYSGGDGRVLQPSLDAA